MPAEVQALDLTSLEAEQAQLEEQVAFSELERETTKTDLTRFQKRYYDMVGRLYVELDKLLSSISEKVAAANPHDIAAQNEAIAAQERARISAEEAGLLEAQPDPPAEISAECKKSYRKAAMLMHPDRATSDSERVRRTQMMVKINLAYERGDRASIEKLMIEFGEDPEAITGVDAASRAKKATLRIAQLCRRLEEIEQELDALRQAEIFHLMTRVEEAEALGDSPLSELAAQLLKEISKCRQMRQ